MVALLEVRVGSTLPVREGEFLLVKSRTGAARGLWNNPGGRLEESESFEDAAVRETREETGYLVSLGRLLAMYHCQIDDACVTKCVYEAQIERSVGARDVKEIEEARWFSWQEIAEANPSLFTVGALTSVDYYHRDLFGQERYTDRVA